MHPSLKEVKVISRCGNYLRCDSSEVPSEGVGNKVLEKGSGKVEAGACQRALSTVRTMQMLEVLFSWCQGSSEKSTDPQLRNLSKHRRWME